MKFCVIGLGQFGSSLACELSRLQHDVLAIDNRDAPVASIKKKVSVAAVADAADIDALREVGVHEVDAVAICIGERFEASLMATSHMQEFGIEKIYCRVVNDVHDRLVSLLDVTEKVRPEAEAARQFAKRLGIEHAKQRFNLTGDFVVLEVEVPKKLIGTRLADARLREDHKLNLVTIRCNGDEDKEEDKNDEERDESDARGICGVPDPEQRFESGDYLVVFGRKKDVEAFTDSD
ncbi:TrkA family potassium uptake protein [Pelagicoccus sp. SDUM812003]|uniref:potassium channel family protein n=1 Tax=Pelagicoccus sp. SDUM812003 TaxID=3041267 RepID=UPI00280D418A|nr:TrkA family potassium uptake protein [Pelagicoccus sp. SDUM812003]MDQ8204004.1 TrkA family potassium uptake protein [Pelagicoccus sp. SDUM812003]